MPAFTSQDEPDLEAVWNWFDFQISLLSEERSQVLQSLRGLGTVNTLSRKRQERFIGLTGAEVEEFFVVQRERLDLLTMFDLLATTEALLRLNFKARVGNRAKDELSRKFRDLERDKSGKIRLDEDLLEALKQCGVPKKIISDMRGVLKLRHWLAHGRHWHPKLGQGYQTEDVFVISRDLIQAIPEW